MNEKPEDEFSIYHAGPLDWILLGVIIGAIGVVSIVFIALVVAVHFMK